MTPEIAEKFPNSAASGLAVGYVNQFDILYVPAGYLLVEKVLGDTPVITMRASSMIGSVDSADSLHYFASQCLS